MKKQNNFILCWVRARKTETVTSGKVGEPYVWSMRSLLNLLRETEPYKDPRERIPGKGNQGCTGPEVDMS